MSVEAILDLRVRDAHAIAAAIRMRRDQGATYPEITRAMRDQFDIYREPATWRYYCNKVGVEGRPNRADLERAFELRDRVGLSYESISALMAHDHDVRLTASGWRWRLIREYAVEKHPRGRPFATAVAA